ncbi:hypothetical protein V491_04100 [Pseudogymnoascus sp. VKM F-3775]|nr:hypothetical protein V491_04100 [Pseudogymnoascus sp. VKM F-3775]
MPAGTCQGGWESFKKASGPVGNAHVQVLPLTDIILRVSATLTGRYRCHAIHLDLHVNIIDKAIVHYAEQGLTNKSMLWAYAFYGVQQLDTEAAGFDFTID